MFRPWKVWTAIGVMVYELIQLSQAPYMAWVREYSYWWVLAPAIAMVAFVWAQAQVTLLVRWRVSVGGFCLAIATFLLLGEPQLALFIATVDEAFTGVAMASTFLYFSPRLRQRLE